MRAAANRSNFLIDNIHVKNKCSNLEIISINGKKKFYINPFYLMLLFNNNYNRNYLIIVLRYFYDQKLVNIISGRIINFLFLKNDFTFAYKNGAA